MDDLFELEDSELDPESKFASEFASELNVEVKKKWEEFKDALLSGNCGETDGVIFLCSVSVHVHTRSYGYYR